MEESKTRWSYIIIVFIVLIIVGVIYFLLKGQKKIISPVPSEPSFKVIYYTPTPGPVTISSTPSGTPKVKAVPTKAPVPTIEASPTITSPSVTVTPRP